MNIRKILGIVTAILFIAAIVMFVLFFTDQENDNYISMMLYLGYIYLGIAGAAVVLFFILSAVTNLEVLKSMLIALVGIAVVGGAGYMLASDTLNTGLEKIMELPEPRVLKLSGAGLISTYILLAVAVLSILVSEVTKIFK